MNSRRLRADFTTELSTASRKMRTLFDGMIRARGLTLSRARTLLHLSKQGPVNQRELAALLEIESSSVVRLLDGLEEQGLIERRPVEGDRRAKQVALTPASAAQVDELEGILEAMRSQMLRQVSARDLAVAVRVLRQVIANMGGHG